ncbi:MAG: hypothetical protein NUW08_02895 [Candidatus Uhrbacteria bacterium]|nr:hypothetical protein [Candidatus Uhrbacteria bacterium]
MNNKLRTKKGGCLTPILAILFLVGCILYLAVTGKERLSFGCEARPAGAVSR